jgi:hypothetical protein
MWFHRISMIAVVLCMFPSVVWSKGCPWDQTTLSYQGSAVAQAKCLLRSVSKGGGVADTEAQLPAHLAARIGQPISISRTAFRAYLAARGIEETSLGGGLDEPLSVTGSEPAHQALYFVIHDTSHVLCARDDFPGGSDASAAPWNLATLWQSSTQAHLYLTRDGAAYSPQGRTFAVPWRATKHEMSVGESSRGRFLHIENIQLRRPEIEDGAPLINAKGDCTNDRIAQSPGFTPKQIHLLGLTYIAASIRAGEWLIPAYHAVIDTSFPDGHDDPQNFDLPSWSETIDTTIADVERIAKVASSSHENGVRRRRAGSSPPLRQVIHPMH